MASRAASASKRGSSGRPLAYCSWMALQLNCDRTATTHRSHPPQSPSRRSAVLLPADAGSKRRATKSWQLVLMAAFEGQAFGMGDEQIPR